MNELLEKLLKIAKEWERFEDDTRCDCASRAYENCAKDLRSIVSEIANTEKT